MCGERERVRPIVLNFQWCSDHRGKMSAPIGRKGDPTIMTVITYLYVPVLVCNPMTTYVN